MRDNITLICKNSRQQPQYRQHRILEMLEQKGWLDNTFLAVRRKGTYVRWTDFSHTLLWSEYFFDLKVWGQSLKKSFFGVFKSCPNVSIFFSSHTIYAKSVCKNCAHKTYVPLQQILSFPLKWMLFFADSIWLIAPYIYYVLFALSWWFSKRYIVMRAISSFFKYNSDFPSLTEAPSKDCVRR